MKRVMIQHLPMLVFLSATYSRVAMGALPTLSVASLEPIRHAEGFRVAQIKGYVEGHKATLGLRDVDGLQEIRHSTDEFGKTHVRFRQTYQGVPVWGTGLIGHMNAQGAIEPTHATVCKDIQIMDGTILSVSEAQALTFKRLGVVQPTGPVVTEKIVFPTCLQDGLKLTRTIDGRFVIDEKYSVATQRKNSPYVWAYLIKVVDDKCGNKELVLDATSGEVLKVWDGRCYDTSGVGHSQYNGNVPINMNLYSWVNQNSSGTSIMPPTGVYNTIRDTTRGTKVWAGWLIDPDVGIPGLKVFWSDQYFATGLASNAGPFLSTGTEWGDGKQFAGFGAGDQSVTIATADSSVNGQTAAVDAYYGVASTWDFYKNVLGRNGIDDLGTSATLWVHKNEGFYQAMYPMEDAYWDASSFSMYFGDGKPSDGYNCFTSMDVTAHEISHGLMEYTAGLVDSEETGGLNEANSDVFSAMTRFYTWGGQGGSTVPDSAPNAPVQDSLWTIGRQFTTDGHAVRNMYKPSLDGYSYDQWFDGIYLDDVHYSMGPANRLFYFLAQGASSTITDVNYSPLLPQGMVGLGNDTAIRIWFRTISTKISDPYLKYAGFRLAMIAAAEEMFGVGSTEVAAVENAFAAINVGAAAGGSDPVLVTLPVMLKDVADDNSGTEWSSLCSSFIVDPTPGIPMLLPSAVITNATNTACSWSIGGLSQATSPVSGGQVANGNSYTSPTINHEFYPVKVSSVQDPNRYAATMVYGVSMDTDMDTEFDAIDLAAYPLHWGMILSLDSDTAIPEVDASNNGLVDDVDIALARNGFYNIFAQ